MYQQERVIVIGAGVTGIAIVKFLSNKVKKLVLIDEHKSIDKLLLIAKQYPGLVVDNIVSDELLQTATKIVLSPGIDPIKYNEYRNKIINDIEIFAHVCDKPVIGITGTNGKSTVVTMLGLIFKTAGYNVGVGGNLGVPALELLMQDYDLYILELSSFQLELTDNLLLDTACVLNVMPDHLDRHHDFDNYRTIKHRIYQRAKNIVFNQDDDNTHPTIIANNYAFGYLTDSISQGCYLNTTNQLIYNNQLILDLSATNIYGTHNHLNCAAVVTISKLYDIADYIIVHALTNYQGLDYRLQVISRDNKITWINDSKATNVGATITAINSVLSDPEQLILLLGGDGKQQDFSELANNVPLNTKLVVVYGKDADILQAALKNCNTVILPDFATVISYVKQAAVSGDTVLFSPGCASYDMFANYIERGLTFNMLVGE